MKKMVITIDEQGIIDMDFQEGFKGMSCVEKSKQIAILLNGETKEQKLKNEYYESEDKSSDVYLRHDR